VREDWEKQSEDFVRISAEDGEWHERRVLIDGHPAAVRISTTGNLVQKALPHATTLCADIGSLSSRFRSFKEAEARQKADAAEEIRGLRIDYIDFVNPAKPDTAEVSLSSESGDDSWACLLVAGEFRDLVMDS
jgi:hypothetical protein